MQEAAGRAGIDLIQNDSCYHETEAGHGCDPHHLRLRGFQEMLVPPSPAPHNSRPTGSGGSRVRPRSGGGAVIAVMKSAHHRYGDEFALARRHLGHRRFSGKPLMRTRGVVVVFDELPQ